MVVNAYGLPIDFEITGGEVHDCKVAPEFIEKLPTADHTIADKGYDVKKLETRFIKNHPSQSSQERVILKLGMQIWIGVFINTGIWWKIYSPG